MASLQARRVRGHTYWYLVESRRVNGKPRPVPVAYIGKADNLLARLQATDELRIASRSHGAVAAAWGLASELGVAQVIDQQLETSGRRSRRREAQSALHPPSMNDGLTVGQSLTLAAVARLCHPTSKRGFAEWAATTTLPELAGVRNVAGLTSQHFWDQMDQVPIECIAPIERNVVARVLESHALPVETLLFDATNFFTFIASTNTRATLPARGHNKQKRDDLRQVGIALVCSRETGIPLLHQTYGGQVADAKSFADALPRIRQRLVDLGRDLKSMTTIYDKGNVSRDNQHMVDSTKLHYVTAVTAASQAELVKEANTRFEPVQLPNGTTVQAYRTLRSIWGVERTAVVLLSERLRQGQMRGVLQHVASAQRWLTALQHTLRRGKQKRDRARIQRDIEIRLHGRQRLGQVLKFDLTGEDPCLTLDFDFDQVAFDSIAANEFGRIVLITDHRDWTTAQIIDAYHGQAGIEAVFAHLKDPAHLALRPQFHWTDQKLHVHVLICMLGYMIGRVLFLRARQAQCAYDSMEALLDGLAKIRRVTVARPSPTGKGRPRIATQLESTDAGLESLLSTLGVK